MNIKESIWGQVVVAAVAIFAAALVAIKVFAPNTPPQIVQEDRLDRIERQLTQLLQQGHPAVDQRQDRPIANQQQVTASPAVNSLALLERIDALEEQIQTELELRRSIEEERSSKLARMDKIESAARDPMIRAKYYRYLDDIRTEQHTDIADAFQIDAVDPLWAQEKMAQIDTIFTSPALKNATLASADCRTSSCRVVFSVSQLDEAESRMFENELIASFSETWGDMHTNIKQTPDGNGNLEYSMYIFRDSAAVPGLPNVLENMSVDEAIEFLNTTY